MKRLNGKVAIVTGAGSGIGAATAALFAREGARVAAVDKNYESALKTVSMVEELKGTGIALECDVSNASDVAEMIAGVVKKLGGTVDVLVNNAGIYFPSTVESVSEKQWDEIIAVDLKGVMLCSRSVIPLMRKQGGGKIVNIASIAGQVGFAQSAAYCAAKGGVILLTKEMALDYAPERIYVNAIAPGVIETPMTKGILEDAETADALVRQTPIGRLGKVEDIAYAALYLASGESDFVVGEVLTVDGGWTIK